MSPARNQYNPIIRKLLQEHDALPMHYVNRRNELQRRLLFLMSTVKYLEIT
ncbi:hypothetical protein ICV01_03010 [Polynucleobacter sp. MWH-Spelu-300-X4]|uniref:hypothetical protein n=1 Tax=Polynucleobacter sp. MWH-Spelu-300-X4 TaxID=2689109 RepID=UPI001BFCF479|nr:hypothetical protein [Polynucleobacter sp. MWH-Spelu-300-X4]QWD80303.1 hypothetical protein ICV01_03010 [Polynucleobacter sp. MWH-Spelu-300-X4]